MADLNTDPAKKGSEEFNKLETYGDLKKIIKSISLKQKGEKIGNVALDQVIGLIPGAGVAKTTYDFVKAAFKKPDAKKTNTWLDKLDIDDQMSAIVDDTVENGFIQAMAKSIEQESDTKPLEPDFNMNAKMVNYLKQQYAGRTVAGIKENKEMTLKEYIKQLTREILDEQEGGMGSTTSAVLGYLSKMAFSPKGQKENDATKAAKKQGFKVTKGETESPGDSKVKDYEPIWKSAKKKKIKIYEAEIEFKVGDKVKYENQEWEVEKILPNGTIRLKHSKGLPSTTVLPNKVTKLEESNFDEASPSSRSSLYLGPSLATKGGGYYKKENMQESLLNIIEQELLSEVTYHKFKNEVKFRTKNEQLHKAIREVKRKLMEIDRIVEYTSRMKQELSEGEEGLKYWKKTESNIATISEMVNHLNNKIKNLNQ